MYIRCNLEAEHNINYAMYLSFSVRVMERRSPCLGSSVDWDKERQLQKVKGKGSFSIMTAQ